MSQVAKSLRTIPGKLLQDMPDRIIAATALHLWVPLGDWCQGGLGQGGGMVSGTILFSRKKR